MRDNCMRPSTAWGTLRDFNYFLSKLASFAEELAVNQVWAAAERIALWGFLVSTYSMHEFPDSNHSSMQYTV